MKKSQQSTLWGWASRLSVILWLGLVCGVAAAQDQATAAATANAQPIIEKVSGSLQGGAEVIRIELSGALTALPHGFSVKTPPRIALDFAGVGNVMGRSTVDINQGNLRSVNIIPAGDRTRMVINLRQATNYKAQLEGKTLLIMLEPVVAATPAVQTNFAESKSRDILPLKDIDFRRGFDGSGRVVVSLANSQVGVDIRQSGQALTVEFMKSSLPEGLRRKLDVADFGTPVQTITTFQVGDRVRMMIEPKGNWEHSAYQSDEQLVVEVKPQKVDPTKLTQGPGYTGQKLSLNFQNIEIRALLQVIADFTNFNVVTSDSVSGTVTLRLQDVPWDQALEIILQAKGLGMRKNGNVLWIAPKDELLAKEKLEREAMAAIQSLEPVRTQSFTLNYAKAVDVAKQLMGGGTGGGAAPAAGGAAAASARILSPRGNAVAEPRTNQLFVTDISSKLEQVQELIVKLDIPVRQVLIEARIVEATDTFGKSLGVRLGGGAYNRNIGTTPSGGMVSGAVGSYLNPETNKLVTTPGYNTNFVNLPSTGALGFPNPGALALSVFSPDQSHFLNLEISALEADGKGKVVSSPRVLTADKMKAIIEQGTELPYQVASSSGATSVAFRKANLKLEVTPQITPEGGIIMTLDVTKDSVGQSTPAGYAIDTKHVNTEVLVENGGTVVIGGIFMEEATDTVAKVPLLGDIPLLGALFRTKVTNKAKRELLVFITPKTLADRTSLR